MDLSSRRLVWRSGLLLRRAAWERRRSLLRELAGYDTAADRAELCAAIDRCASPAGEEIRRLALRAAVRRDADTTPWHLRTSVPSRSVREGQRRPRIQ